MKRWITVLAALIGLVVLAHTQGCALTGKGAGISGSAAQRVYVKPGEHDTYYAFLSGGHSGQIFVYGIPSCRHITTIPVFTPEPASGYGVEERSRAMLGGYTWGDAHHPGLSETDGDYDGRWLFINDMPNARIARIDLKDFTTHEIFGPIPNISAAHACPFPTPNTEYVFAASRFSVPLPIGTFATGKDYAARYRGVVAGVKVDPRTGHMSLGFEILMPPFDWDIADAGKAASNGWEFFTCYNSEEASDSLELKASQNEMDYVAAVNWIEAQKAVDAGKADQLGGAPVLDPAKVKGIVYLIPVPKSPHGVDVDPSGEYICVSGKLQAEVSVLSTKKMLAAIAAGKFEDAKQGVPVLPFRDVLEAKVPVGLGPLHTQFDGKGYAYTSLFLDSQIAKWKIGTWAVTDKIDVYYSIGHLMASEGDTRHPTGEYLVALDKLSKDRYLSVGPSHPEGAQLIDLRGPKMELLYDFPTYPEPHYAQMIRAEKLKPLKIYSLAENANPDAVKRAEDARVERKGRRVDAFMIAVRSHFTPDVIHVAQGDTVYFHVTNVEQDEDITHGFGILFSSKDMQVEPGETKTIRWVAEKSGITPFYCSNFCSALHQEMQGYLEVSPAGTPVAALQRPGAKRVAEVAALMSHR
jgi:nitrous-oxide reductase